MTKTMTFLDHLEELRKRIIFAIIAVSAGAIIAYIFSQFIVDLLTRPVTNLVFLSPAEAFMTRIKVAIIAGLFLASPIIFYQFWRFIKPGLLHKETHYIPLAILFSTLFFLLGLVFSYFVLIPIGIKFFLSFETTKIQAMLSFEKYIGFVARLLFGAGLVFQLPVAIYFLTKIGIINPGFLRRNRRVAIVIVFIIAAVVTPPDVFSQLLMVIPLIILYEISILGSVLASPKKPKNSLKPSL